LKLNDIITEADVRVSNTFSSAQKVSWLNEINNEFFDVVKIPAASLFTSIAGIAAYILHLLADPVAAPVLSQAANVGSTLPATN
jgi:hypothetical protein